jgi:hypothetical protein
MAGEEEKILLRATVCAYLTFRLMGDPIDCVRWRVAMLLSKIGNLFIIGRGL